MIETKVTIAAPTNRAHLPAMHNVHLHMSNQETTVVALFMKRTKIFLLYDFNLQ